MFYYKLTQVLIFASVLIKVIIQIIFQYYGVSNFIINNQNFILVFKFWLLLY